MNIGDLMGPAVDGSGYVGVLNFHGLLLGIEHATGDYNPWSKRKTRASYGEFPGTLGNDGDPVDFLLGHEWDTDAVYVVQQRVPNGQNEGAGDEGNGGPAYYDEDKVVLGAKDEADARALFEDYYHGSGREVGGVLLLTIAELGERLGADELRGFGLFKGLDGCDPVTGGPIVARFYRALDRVAKSQTPPAGFTPVPGGTHGGYRKKRAGRGYDYWYPDEHKEGDHPDWEATPGSTGTSSMKPGQFALVLGHGTKLFKWTPDHDGELPDGQTWMQDTETGEHVAVLTNRVQPARGKAKTQTTFGGGKRGAPPARPAPRKPAPAPAPGGAGPAWPAPPPKGGDNPTFTPQDSPTSDAPAEGAPRVPVFADSTAKAGTVLHNIEHGAYGVLRYRDAAGRTQVGMYVPQADQRRFLDEMRGLTHAAVTAVAKNYRIRDRGAGGGMSPEYQDLYSAAQLGLVQAVRAYKGRVSFAAHAHRYMRTYAAMEARDSLGRGVPVPSRIRRLTEGYLASVNRACVANQTDSPTDEQVAAAWNVTKKHVFQRDLGRYLRTGDGDEPTVVDQASEQLPMEDWQVRTPTGAATGKFFPGKMQLVEELRRFTAGDRTEGSEWMEDMQVASVLPHYAATNMPVGTALHLRQEVDGILADMDPAHAQALTLRWGLDDGEPMELSELASALKLAEGGTKKAGISAAEKLVNKAKESFKRLADARKAEAGRYAETWSTGSPGEQVVVEPASPDARSYGMLATAFKGDNDSDETVDERVRIYTALAAEGAGRDAEAALTREAKGEATPEETDALRARYFEARDKQRLRAFHLQTRTVPVDPSEARDVGAGTDSNSDALYADEVLHGYMRAVARRGMPGFSPAPAGSNGPSKVWSDEKLARFLGVPVERLAARSGDAQKSAESEA